MRQLLEKKRKNIYSNKEHMDRAVKINRQSFQKFIMKKLD